MPELPEERFRMNGVAEALQGLEWRLLIPAKDGIFLKSRKSVGDPALGFGEAPSLVPDREPLDPDQGR